MSRRESTENATLAAVSGATVYLLDGKLITAGAFVGVRVDAGLMPKSPALGAPEVEEHARAVRDRLHALLTVTRAQEPIDIAALKDWAWRAPRFDRLCSHCGQKITDERKPVLGSVAHTIVDLRLVRAALDALPWTVDRVVVAPEAGRLVVSCRHWQFVVAAYVPPDGTHIEPLLARTPAPAPTEERLLRRKDEPSRKSEKRLYGFNAWPSKTRNRVSSRQEAAHEGDVPETRAREEDT